MPAMRAPDTLLRSAYPHPTLLHPARLDGQGLTHARAQHTSPGLRIEQRAMRMTHYVPAVAREKFILAIFEWRVLMRAAVHERADKIFSAQDKDCVATRAVWIKSARRVGKQLIDAAK